MKAESVVNMNHDTIKMHHYVGLRHAKAVLTALLEKKKKDGTLENISPEDAMNLCVQEIYKAMQEMRRL